MTLLITGIIWARLTSDPQAMRLNSDDSASFLR